MRVVIFSAVFSCLLAACSWMPFVDSEAEKKAERQRQEELKTLTDFAATPEGQALNRALFQGFDRMYAQLSLGLGLAIASLGQYEEL